ncbi:hypothetical protein [Halorientalis halophila]|uniref:hypothetical protein n=1 Tax=Halorientalis halophila TaxID=3108499 RepID=UPI00300A30A4
MDVSEHRTLALIALLVVGGIAASLGYVALAENPIEPETDVTIEDAPATYDLNEPGRVSMVTIRHVDGDSIPLSELQIVLGSRGNGIVLQESSNWTDTQSGVTVRAFAGDRPLPNASVSQFDGERELVVAKTDGTLSLRGPANVTVRLRHLPSDATLRREVVTME